MGDILILREILKKVIVKAGDIAGSSLALHEYLLINPSWHNEAPPAAHLLTLGCIPFYREFPKQQKSTGERNLREEKDNFACANLHPVSWKYGQVLKHQLTSVLPVIVTQSSQHSLPYDFNLKSYFLLKSFYCLIEDTSCF